MQRVEYWSSYFNSCLVKKKVDYGICRKTCTPDPDDVVYIVFGSLGGAFILAMILLAFKARAEAKKRANKIVQVSDVQMTEFLEAERERKRLAAEEAPERQARRNEPGADL